MAHPVLPPNVSSFSDFSARVFLLFWGGQQTIPCSFFNQDHFWMTQICVVHLMECNQTLGQQNWSGAHPYIHPNVPQDTSFVAIFFSVLKWSTDFYLWYKRNGTSWVMQTYFINPMQSVSTLGLQNFSVANPFLSQNIVLFSVFSARVFLFFWGWSTDYFLQYQNQDTSWMIQTSCIYPMGSIHTLGKQNWSSAHSILFPNVC